MKSRGTTAHRGRHEGQGATKNRSQEKGKPWINADFEDQAGGTGKDSGYRRQEERLGGREKAYSLYHNDAKKLFGRCFWHAGFIMLAALSSFREKYLTGAGIVL